jgi:hypothetical protein
MQGVLKREKISRNGDPFVCTLRLLLTQFGGWLVFNLKIFVRLIMQVRSAATEVLLNFEVFVNLL